MATGTNAIATEGEVKTKLGYSGTVDTNKCCTKSRAITFGANSSNLAPYENNQLVKYSDVDLPGLDPNTAPNGVYICDNKSRLWKKSDWDTSNNDNASGVAVKTDNCEFVIAKEEQTSIQWGGYGTLINRCTTTTNSNTAETDYKGKQNTDAIVSQLGTSKTYAARYCKEYTFPHGAQGYLPAFGELYEAYQNKSEVDACMLLISGRPVYDGSIINYRKWSSTQYDSNFAWNLDWVDGMINGNYKYLSDTYCCARPFAAFK